MKITRMIGTALFAGIVALAGCKGTETKAEKAEEKAEQKAEQAEEKAEQLEEKAEEAEERAEAKEEAKEEAAEAKEEAAEAKEEAAEEAAAPADGKTAHQRLQGTWNFDVDKMIAADERMAAMIKEKPEMADKMKEMVKTMKVTITEDKVTIAGGPGQEKTGTYTVKTNEPNKVVIESKMEDEEKTETLTFEFTGPDAVKGTQDDREDVMYLVRSKE